MFKMTQVIFVLLGAVLCILNPCSAEGESAGADNDKRYMVQWQRPQSNYQNNNNYRPNGYQQGGSQPIRSNPRTTRRPPGRGYDYLRPSGDFGLGVNNLTSAVNFPPNPPEASTPSSKLQKLFNPCEKDCHKIPDDYPVCGTDKITYINVTHLKCAQTCGKRVKTAYTGRCRNAPTPTGMYISPGRSKNLDERER